MAASAPVKTEWPELRKLINSSKLNADAKKYIIYTIVEKFNYTAQITEGFNPDNIPEHHILLHNLKKIKSNASRTSNYAKKYNAVINALLLGKDEKKGSRSGSESEEEEDKATGFTGRVRGAIGNVGRAVTLAREITSKLKSKATAAVKTALTGLSKAPEYMQLIATMHAKLTESSSTDANYKAILDKITNNHTLAPLITDYTEYNYTELTKPELPAGWENYYGFNIATLNIAGCAAATVNKFLESITIRPKKTPATDLILIQGAHDKFTVSKDITNPPGSGKSYVDKSTINTITLYDTNALELVDNRTLTGEYQGKTWTASYSDRDKLVIINFDSGARFNISQFQDVLDKINRYTNITRRLDAGYKLLIAGTFGEVDADRLRELETSLQSLAKGLGMFYPLKTIKIGDTWTNSLYIITNANFNRNNTKSVCDSSNAIMGKLEYFLDDTQVKAPTTGKEMKPEDVDKEDSRSSNDNSRGKKGKAKTRFAFAVLLTSITEQYNTLTHDQRGIIIGARKFYNNAGLEAELQARATAKAEADRQQTEIDYNARQIEVNGTVITVPTKIISNDTIDFNNFRYGYARLNARYYIPLTKTLPTTEITLNNTYTITWTHTGSDGRPNIYGTFNISDVQHDTPLIVVGYGNGTCVLFDNHTDWVELKTTTVLPKKTAPAITAAPSTIPAPAPAPSTTATPAPNPATTATTPAPAPAQPAAPDIIRKDLTNYVHDNLNVINGMTKANGHAPTNINITDCVANGQQILDGEYNIIWSHKNTQYIFGSVKINISGGDNYIIITYSTEGYLVHDKTAAKTNSLTNVNDIPDKPIDVTANNEAL